MPTTQNFSKGLVRWIGNNWIDLFGWFSILVLSTGILISIFGHAWLLSASATVHSAMCDDNGGCVLGWFGALGGWAAAIAALVTLTFLSNQHKAAQKLHYSQDYTTANSITFETTRTTHFLNLLTERIRDLDREFSDENVERVRDALAVIKGIFQSTKVTDFMSRIAKDNCISSFTYAVAKIDESLVDTLPANIKVIRINEARGAAFPSRTTLYGNLGLTEHVLKNFLKFALDDAIDYKRKWEKIHGSAKSADEFLEAKGWRR